ncbi:hypothetical protein ACP0HM_03695 [Escherichia coli]
MGVSRHRADLNLAAGGVIFERTFRRRAKQGEIIILHKNMYGLGLLFFST